jgi:hypothetical protein
VRIQFSAAGSLAPRARSPGNFFVHRRSSAALLDFSPPTARFSARGDFSSSDGTAGSLIWIVWALDGSPHSLIWIVFDPSGRLIVRGDFLPLDALPFTGVWIFSSRRRCWHAHELLTCTFSVDRPSAATTGLALRRCRNRCKNQSTRSSRSTPYQRIANTIVQ